MSLECHKLTFEVLTPLFMGRSAQFFREDGATANEMESDVAVGAMNLVGRWRFWFRALAGGLLGTTKLTEIAKRERELFGGLTDTDSVPSSFRMWVSQPGSPLVTRSADDLSETDKHLSYLAFGMGSRKSRGRVIGSSRWAIAPGGVFSIEIVTSDERWKRLEPIIDLATAFGGYGARHSRGLGSLQWTSLDDKPRQCAPGDVLKTALTSFGNPVPATASDQEPSFPVLSGKHSTLKVCGPYDPLAASAAKPAIAFATWSDALLAVRRQLRVEHQEVNADGSVRIPGFFALGPGFGYRHRVVGSSDVFMHDNTSGGGYPYVKAIDHDEAYKAKTGPGGGPPPRLKNPMFGLPLVYAPWKHTVNLGIPGDALRRPSPVTFTVLRDSEGLKVLVGLFRSRFGPAGKCVTMARVPEPMNRRAGGVAKIGGLPNWKFLDDFMTGCTGSGVTIPW